MAKIIDVDPINWHELWGIDPDDEIFCGICGYGYDTWKEVQMHMFQSHYEIVKNDAKEWFKNG